MNPYSRDPLTSPKYCSVIRSALIDSGAQHSAISRDVANLLGLSVVGHQLVTVGSGEQQLREIVRVNITVQSAKAEDCPQNLTSPGENTDGIVDSHQQTCSKTIALDVSIRDKLPHSLLGIDWVKMAKPKFIYSNRSQVLDHFEEFCHPKF